MCKGPRAGGREQDEADMEENISAPRGRGAGWGGAQAGGPRAPSPLLTHVLLCTESRARYCGGGRWNLLEGLLAGQIASLRWRGEGDRHPGREGALFSSQGAR